LRTKNRRVGVTQLRTFSRGVSLFPGVAVTTLRCSNMAVSSLWSNACRVAEFMSISSWPRVKSVSEYVPITSSGGE